MTINFEDDKYVPQAGSGRQAEPNPYTDIIAAIALKTDPDTGKPQAKGFTLEHDGTDEARDKAIAKVRRQMSLAGEANEPPVTVHVTPKPVTNPVNKTVSKTKTRIVFWTTKKQRRPKKAQQTTTTE